jgi:hypothetical protein
MKHLTIHLEWLGSTRSWEGHWCFAISLVSSILIWISVEILESCEDCKDTELDYPDELLIRQIKLLTYSILGFSFIVFILR